jgi:hypothetical protein
MNLSQLETAAAKVLSNTGEAIRQYFAPSEQELHQRIMDLFEQEDGPLTSFEVAFRSGTFPLTALVALEQLSADTDSLLRKETLFNYPIGTFAADGTIHSNPVTSVYSKRQ